MKRIFRNLTKVSLLIAITIPFANLTAQKNKIELEHFSTEQGLSQNSIMRIFQDSRGFLWICTFDGLNRFDVYQFKIFRNIPGDFTSLSNNKILSICEDKSGEIWIGTYCGGLNKYDTKCLDEDRYSIRKSIKQLTYFQRRINER